MIVIPVLSEAEWGNLLSGQAPRNFPVYVFQLEAARSPVFSSSFTIVTNSCGFTGFSR
jgi:hypothetical protein